jgi:hypothetical protein
LRGVDRHCVLLLAGFVHPRRQMTTDFQICPA